MVSDGTNVEGADLTPNVAPEGTAEPEAKQPEPPTVEELQKQLADEKAARAADAAKRAELETNYKAMQRNLEAARREGQSNTEIRKLIEELQENQAATLDLIDSRAEQGYEAPVPPAPQVTPKKSRLEALREDKAAKASFEQRAENARLQMVKMLAVSGIDPQTAAQATDQARIAFQQGKYEDAVELFTQGLAYVKRTPAAPPNMDREIEERASLKALQMMKERGLLDMELGGATAASSGSMEDTEDRYMRGDITASEYEKALKKHTGG